MGVVGSKRPNPNLEAAVQAFAEGMSCAKVRKQFRISCRIVRAEAWARGLSTKSGRLTPLRQQAIDAYAGGKSALAIQRDLGIHNQTLYRWLKRAGVKKHRHPKSVLCWWCGKPVKEKHHKTCGEHECMHEAGIALPWQPDETKKLLRMAAGKVPVADIAAELPGRTRTAVQSKLARLPRRDLEMRMVA